MARNWLSLLASRNDCRVDFGYKELQWNPSKMDTPGSKVFVLYSEVSYSSGVSCWPSPSLQSLPTTMELDYGVWIYWSLWRYDLDIQNCLLYRRCLWLRGVREAEVHCTIKHSNLLPGSTSTVASASIKINADSNKLRTSEREEGMNSLGTGQLGYAQDNKGREVCN